MTEDEQVLRDYCLEHDVPWGAPLEGVHRMDLQWVYTKALLCPGDPVRPLAQRVLSTAPRTARGVFVYSRAWMNAKKLVVPGVRSGIEDPDVWAAGDPVREWELAAARGAQVDRPAAQPPWEMPRVAHPELWRSPEGLSIETLWSAFAAGVALTDNLASTFLGQPWPGESGLDALLRTQRVGFRQLEVVRQGDLLVLDFVGKAQLQLNVEALSLRIIGERQVEWVVLDWARSAVDVIWPVLGPPGDVP